MEQGDSREIAAPEVPHQDRPRLALSATQLVASVLAAVTAAVLASYLGVNGTVIGAAVVSLLSALGTAVFGHSIERTGHRVRTVVPASARWIPAREIASAPAPVRAMPTRSQSRLGQIAMTAAAVFAAALALLTTVELFAGRPISDLIKGQSASGTTVFGSQVRNSTPVPTVTLTVVPKVVVSTPTITQTAPPVTVTPTPTVTVTPAPSATPTPSSTTTTP